MEELLNTLEKKRASHQRAIDKEYEKAPIIAKKAEITDDELTELQSRLDEMKENFDHCQKLNDDIVSQTNFTEKRYRQ
jgi:peptidoglycan hydrolase CwlO-like protein